VATGILISAEDQQSAQQDIVIYDKRVLPPILFEGGPVVVPVESALATIEVKSCLSAQELRKAEANAITVRDLNKLSGTRNEQGQYVARRILSESGESLGDSSRQQRSAPVAMLFALDSDLSPKGKTEVERHSEVCTEDPHVLRGTVAPSARLGRAPFS
jgi:hypothetical protein